MTGASVLLLVVAPLVGRVFLACLPPGLPGRHAPRELPATWAASFLVGLTWFIWVGTVAPPDAWTYVAFGVPLLACLAQFLLAPAGLVPRHESVRERTSILSRAGIVLGVIAIAWFGMRGEAFVHTWPNAILLLAAAILLHESLAIAGVTGWLRVVALSLIGLAVLGVPQVDEAERLALLGTSGVALGAVGWIRRGDRRGLALASVAILFLAHFGPSGIPIALGTGLCLVLASAKPTRRRAFVWIGVAFVLGLLPRLALRARVPMTGVVESDREWLGIALLAVLISMVAVTVLLRIRREPPAWNPSGAPLHREIVTLACGAFLAHFLVPAIGSLPATWTARVMPIPPATLSFRVLLILVVAIALARALERRPRAT